MLPDNSPILGGALALLFASLALYLLRIPQGARILGQGFKNLITEQEKMIAALSRRLDAAEGNHDECEKRSEVLERRVRALERQIGKLP